MKNTAQNTGENKDFTPVNHNILNQNGYFKRHFELCKTCRTQQDAFEIVEQEFRNLADSLQLHRRVMFSTYESFRMSKSNYYSVKKNR